MSFSGMECMHTGTHVMGQELLLNMRHHNAGWKGLSWVTRLNLPRKIMYDWRLTGDGLTLQKC